MNWKRMKLYEIIPGKLYQRGNFRKLTKEEKLQFLSYNKINIVVGLAGKKSKDLEELEKCGKLYYFYYPFADIGGTLTQENKENLLRVSKEVASLIEKGNCAVSHCHRGRNRSALMNCLIWVQLTGKTGKEAVSLMREKRPNSLGNEQFVRFLEEL